jgi:hypothetical protein
MESFPQISIKHTSYNYITPHLFSLILTGWNDAAKCHHCGISLCDWIQTDLASVEHARYSTCYLQNLECNQIFKILTDNSILGYFRYVEDIFIVYNNNYTDINKVQTAFNNLAPTIKFTMENETNNGINFLDITINKETNNFSINIYRKPTTTDVIIPQDSCHPHEHKHAAIRYVLNRLNTY